MDTVYVIGAGLAGCEAAWQLALHKINVVLIEMKPVKFSPAHKYKGFAELVCSNSLKAKRIASASGLLKEEMRILGSLTVESALDNEIPAGGALAVDREKFSDEITQKIKENPYIKVVSEEAKNIPDSNVIIATGPLTSDALAERINALCGGSLSFYDAAAPIVTYDSIDKGKVFFAARYDKGTADYINCPFTKEEYLNFYNAIINAEIATLHEFDKSKKDGFDVYEGCMPIEILAKRGEETMRYGAMKPVGIIDPKTGKRPYAVVQLRCENNEKTLYNIVGFQTNLKFGEQKRVFSMIPGLENAEFARYGVMHRNSFIDSPRLLNSDFSFKGRDNLFFAGQITGVEGYMESAASGIMAGINMSRKILGKDTVTLPKETMIGALSRYISDESVKNFQPMGANMGVLPSLEERIKGKEIRYEMLSKRSLNSLSEILNENGGIL